MRFVLVIDDNGPEFTEQPPEQVLAEIAEVLDEVRLQLADGDRSRVLFVEDDHPVGGFSVTLGVTEGRPGWERTR